MKPSTCKFTKYNFDTFISSINRCYSKSVQRKLPKSNDFPRTIFDSEHNLNLNELIDIASTSENIYLSSVAKRIVGVALIQYSRDENIKLDLRLAWQMISRSILDIPSECTVSSIGSQGFLSIPLFKYDLKMAIFDFIRIHIWHDDLFEFIDNDLCERLSIHSHSFLAQSWVICGSIINERYSVANEDGESASSLFKIEYNKTLNEVNQHTSMAVNTGQNVSVRRINKEVFSSGDVYQIEAGKFHKSVSAGDNGLSSTFFSFTTQSNQVVQSYVTGPSTMKTSEINRKMQIDPKKLINAIDHKINLND